MNSRSDPLAETYPPLSPHEALVEANRCLYCYDAPCMHACPTHIDIPRFIKKIATGNLSGSARTILEANLLGGTCARVCPVQELCEGACVLGADHKPISIGRLQRYATDAAGELSRHFSAGAATGKKVAVVGSGPAGLSCAGELRKLGHEVTVFEKRDLPGGLSTYGIISLREPTDIAVREAEMIGELGVKLEYGVEPDLSELKDRFDAVFLAVGLGATPQAGIENEEYILDGLRFIEESKVNQSGMKIGKHVAVIGAGNTAIDCATIAKRLGAESVTILYRRGEEDMPAYPHEVEFIRNEGVGFMFRIQATKVLVEGGEVTGLRCISTEKSASDEPQVVAAGPALRNQVVTEDRAWEEQPFDLRFDQLIKAIGQTKPSIAAQLGLETNNGFIAVNDQFQTSTPGIYAGGDCIRSAGSASTVMAVQDGKLAARAIDNNLGAKNG